jgi:site-specific DNA recombinase
MKEKVMAQRAAIYARHSTSMQNPMSSADQVAAARKIVEGFSGEVVEVFMDPEVSGYRRDRPGLTRLIEAVRKNAVDVVVAESLDRIARDPEDIAWFGKQLAFCNVELRTSEHGLIDSTHLAVASLIGGIFLDNLRAKTLRGMEAAAFAGRSVGGRTYGYRTVSKDTLEGIQISGILEIVETEAAIVRRIYAEYAAGASAITIAAGLNEDRVPSPRGKLWNASTIRGDPKKHTGILNNPLYCGKLIWGRRQWRRDPSVAHRPRRYTLRPEKEWVTTSVPDLRIVSEDVLQSVRAEIRRRALPPRSAVAYANRQKHLLSGQIRCGSCGANFVVNGRDYYRCKSYGEGHPCSNRQSIRIGHLEAAVLDLMRHTILTPTLAAVFAEEFNDELRRQRSGSEAAVTADAQRLEQIEAELANLEQNLLAGRISDTLARLIEEREAEKRQLEAKQDVNVSPAPRLKPIGAEEMKELFEAKVADLHNGLGDPDVRLAAIAVVQSLISRIAIYRAEDVLEAEIELDPAHVVGLAATNGPAHDLGTLRNSILVVAGVGFEPTTFRL